MINKRFLLLTLLFPSLVHSFDISDNQYTAVKNIGINSLLIGACGLGYYALCSYKTPAEFYVKNSHPFAQVWYDEMAAKYPQANFGQRRFLSARRGLLNNDVTWETAFNDTYAPTSDLQRIHEIYKKKHDNLEITKNDQLVLSVCEFLLLHGAAHIKNQDSTGRLYVSGSLFVAMEIITALYRSTQMYNPVINTDYLFGKKHHLDEYCGILACSMACLAYVRYTESRAHQFACDHAATVEVLSAGKLLFESLDEVALAAQHPENEDDYELAQYIISHPSLRSLLDFLEDPQHPGLSVRAEMIQNEINRRLQLA